MVKIELSSDSIKLGSKIGATVYPAKLIKGGRLRRDFRSITAVELIVCELNAEQDDKGSATWYVGGVTDEKPSRYIDRIPARMCYPSKADAERSIAEKRA